MIRILKNKYFNRNRKISAMILFLNLELYRKLVFISEEKKKVNDEKTCIFDQSASSVCIIKKIADVA